MEELIEQYLFQHKRCPLPLLGSLQIKEGAAIAWHGDNKLSAPVPQIKFSNTEIASDDFIAFIASKLKISNNKATILLDKYCSELRQLGEFKEMKLEHSGAFFVDKSGVLLFKQHPLPKEFFPSLTVQRVSHAKPASHAIIVGDKETTREEMTEYFSEKAKKKRENWWIGALLLASIAAGLLFFYFKDHSINDNFGNINETSTHAVEQTYQTK